MGLPCLLTLFPFHIPENKSKELKPQLYPSYKECSHSNFNVNGFKVCLCTFQFIAIPLEHMEVSSNLCQAAVVTES